MLGFKQQINQLEDMNKAELAAKFKELYGFEPGQTNIRNLRRRIAYRIQELVFGGIPESDWQLLETIASQDAPANLKKGKPAKIQGVRYQRIWKGNKYEVTVLENGKYQYDGKVYQSLSAIAKAITGTHWNGKLFFGVK